MSLKFFLYTSRFWKRAAANGETSRPICDMHSVSLNKVSIWGSKFTNNSPVPGAFTNKEASSPMWISSICEMRSTVLLLESSMHTQGTWLSHFGRGSWSVLPWSWTSQIKDNGVTHSSAKFTFSKGLSSSWGWSCTVDSTKCWGHKFLTPDR